MHAERCLESELDGLHRLWVDGRGDQPGDELYRRRARPDRDRHVFEHGWRGAALDLEYETDLNAPTAGWELPGESAFSQHSTGDTAPAASTAPGTVYTIDDTSKAPSLTNPVGAMTFATPYSSVRFDNTLWSLYDSGEESALFDYQRTVPAGGSVTITWSYAAGTTVAGVQGDAAAARDAMQAPSVAISSPAGGSTLTSSPVTVTGSASAGSGVKSVTVNGIAATLSGTRGAPRWR